MIVKAFEVLLDKGEVDQNIVLLIDEMHLQQSSQYDGKDDGQNVDGELYKGILCFMTISLKRSVPYVLHYVPVTKLNGDIVADGIETCIQLLSGTKFCLRAADITDNHTSNVSAYRKLISKYRIDHRNYVITLPSPSSKMSRNIYLLFDTVHLIKNVRNNLAKSRGFRFPSFQYSISGRIECVLECDVSWKLFHRIREKDEHCKSHLRKAPKLTSNAIHFTNNKQSVKLALALFDETTIAATEVYFPQNKSQTTFLKLMLNW